MSEGWRTTKQEICAVCGEQMTGDNIQQVHKVCPPTDTDNQTNVADFDKLKAEQTEDIEYLKRALKDTDAIWKRHREELDRLTEDIETLHQQRILADREAEKLKEDVEQLWGRQKTDRVVISELKEELALTEYQVIGLNKDVGGLKEDVTFLLSAKDDMDTNCDTFNERINDLQGAMSFLGEWFVTEEDEAPFRKSVGEAIKRRGF